MGKRNFYNTFVSSIVFLTALVFFSADLRSQDKPGDEFIAGKVEFTGKNGKEGILVITSPEKAFLLNKGVLLVIKRGEERIVLKINDVEGKYLRCRVDSETGNTVIKEGEDVFYSDSYNSDIKYRDAKRILAEHIRLYENFILKIESTEDTRIIADAVRNLSAELDKLIPEMKRINSKYPELGQKNALPPVELQGETSRLEILEPRLKEAFFKIRMFSSDENVKKATEDLQKILKKINTDK